MGKVRGESPALNAGTAFDTSPLEYGCRGRNAHAADVAVWGIYNNPDLKKDSKDGQIVSVEATLDVVGKEQQDVVVAAVLNCDRDEYAAQLGMMIPGFISMGCGAIFGDNPELGQKLLDTFKTKTDGAALRMSLRITPEIAKFLSEFIARTAKESTAAEDKTATPASAPAKPRGGAPAAK